MSLIIHRDLEQGSDEWLAARCGLVTASVVGKLITPSLKVASNDTSRGVLATIAAERITGHVDPIAVTADMWRGTDDEPLARDKYAEHNAPVEQVGFMTRDDWGFTLGYSPDGLVGDDGLIEIKSRRPKKHLQTVLADEVPPENMAQIQCGLLVSGRAWCDYVSYAGGMRLWTKRVEPDPTWMAVITDAGVSAEVSIAAMVARYEAATEGLPMTERTPDYTEMEIF